MRKINLAVGAMVVIVVGGLSLLGNRPQSKPTYNPAVETLIAGTVLEVEEFYCPITEDRSSHLIVKTKGGPVMVHVGIARTLRAHHITFLAGDQVEVVGSKFHYQGSDSLIAREISRGRETFIIRDVSGKLRLTDQ